MFANACVDKQNVGNQCQHEWHTDGRSTGEVQPRNDSRQVHREDKEKHCGEDRQKTLAVFDPQVVFDDALANKVEPEFHDALSAGGNDLHLARCQPEQDHDDDDDQKANQHQTVDFERRPREEDRRREEVLKRRSLEAP